MLMVMETEKLKQRLISEYEGEKIEDFHGAEEIQTDKGPVLTIKSEKKIKFRVRSPEKALNNIISDLKLIRGIGPYTEKKLKKQGFKTIEDLKEHLIYQYEAIELIKILESCDAKKICDRICLRLPRSHPLVLCTSGFSDVEDFLFLDIETLGLKNQPIILLGEAKISNSKIEVNQHLSRNLKEEPAVLSRFLSNIGEEDVFVTFNGSNFDIPYIKDRLINYQMNRNLERHHLDLLHFSRRFWGHKLPNCRLNTLERHLLEIERDDDVPSGLVPDFYLTYRKHNNIGPLIPIIEHNKQDIITLAKILARLHEQL
jgi:uncharacterized protein